MKIYILIEESYSKVCIFKSSKSGGPISHSQIVRICNAFSVLAVTQLYALTVEYHSNKLTAAGDRFLLNFYLNFMEIYILWLPKLNRLLIG